MNQTLILIALIALTSACGLKSPRASQKAKTNHIPPIQELTVKNELKKINSKEFVDYNTGSSFQIVASTSDNLLYKSFKKTTIRPIGTIRVEYDKLTHQTPVERPEPPVSEHFEEKYDFKMYIMKNRDTREVYFMAPKSAPKILESVRKPVVVKSFPEPYCSKVFYRYEFMGIKIMDELNCNENGICKSIKPNSIMAGEMKLENLDPKNSTFIYDGIKYLKKETKQDSIEPLKAIIEVEEDDPSQLKTIEILMK